MPVFAAALLIAQAAGASTPLPPPKCDTAEYAALDFWVGEWDVFPAGSDKQVARSRIEKLYNGCAIRENWMPAKGANGGSLSGYDPRTQRWHQTWIGSAPGVIQFDGGLVDSVMVLTGSWPGSGPNGEDGLTRMSYSPLPQGAVRQHGEFSGDGGASWITTFDFTYRPHQGGTP